MNKDQSIIKGSGKKGNKKGNVAMELLIKQFKAKRTDDKDNINLRF